MGVGEGCRPILLWVTAGCTAWKPASRAVTHVRSGGEGNLEPLQGVEGLCLSQDLRFAVPQAWL